MSEVPGSAPAGTPAATPAAGSTGGAPAVGTGAWYESIADQDLRGFVQTRGWKDPGSVVDSYRNLEKLVGVPQDRLLKLPNDDDAEGWKGVWSKLGRPENPDGYQLPVPEGMPGDFAKEASAKFHELGIPAKQAQELAKWWNEKNSSVMQSYEAERAQKAELDMQQLRQEWGQTYDAEVEKGRRAVRQFGIDQESLQKIEDAIGTASLLKMFSKIGNGLAEASFEGGENASQGFGTSKDAAIARINALKSDQNWTAKYLAGDVQAKSEMTRLMQLAYGG